MALKLYLVTRTDDVDWDEYKGKLIAAPSPQKAMVLASIAAAQHMECRLVGYAHPSVKEGLIIGDLKAG